MVQDYLSGLKCLLYMDACEDFSTWNGQSMPTPKHQTGKQVVIKDVIGKVNLVNHMELSTSRILGVVYECEFRYHIGNCGVMLRCFPNQEFQDQLD